MVASTATVTPGEGRKTKIMNALNDWNQIQKMIVEKESELLDLKNELASRAENIKNFLDDNQLALLRGHLADGKPDYVNLVARGVRTKEKGTKSFILTMARNDSKKNILRLNEIIPDFNFPVAREVAEDGDEPEIVDL